MWTRIIGAVVAVVVAVVAYESFSGDENNNNNTNDKDNDGFTPAENEMRHVELNKPFDISVGQEVLLPDGESRGYLSFKDTSSALEFTFALDGVTHNLEFRGQKDRIREVGGYIIVLLDFTPDSRVEVEDIYGKNHYVAKVVISGA